MRACGDGAEDWSERLISSVMRFQGLWRTDAGVKDGEQTCRVGLGVVGAALWTLLD